MISKSGGYLLAAFMLSFGTCGLGVVQTDMMTLGLFVDFMES